ncbi:glycoside hydrolase family 76 protein [Talaromyces proteolyticus]|uniref:Glycoside hydrolase family 76 protein n=1 Tax=Talaromyces proteolyticus TaxID=1131652 RepID=A0AAD4KJ83_9EURO|nr:glycoside hydrolase family 76 protein [Talaromyces proteolyticus]KAH8692765.1 glycoside hydrolase family 76 protein [Talaromyces proteolyticus]
MTVSTLLALGLIASTHMVAALAPGDAEAMYDGFNNALLVSSGSAVFYKKALDSEDPDGTWSASLNILGAEDAFERTGDQDKQALVNSLLTTWLNQTPPPWSWDGWNDDIGWFTLALIRGYQMTGNSTFLDEAKYGFDYAFGRGWDTKYNGGGIWEQNPEYLTSSDGPPNKQALSNDSLGKVACMIYQSTHDSDYLDKCQLIYNWVVSNLYESSTGQINGVINETGFVTPDSTAAYNQGTFLDYSNLLYEITGNNTIYDIAQNALDYAMNNLTVNGIFSNNAGYLNTWADEAARGVGHFVRDQRLWDKYYAWMVKNADAILANRRTDLNITWNGWDTPTSDDNTLSANKFVSAMAWLQFTPPTQPSDKPGGVHVITNNLTGMAIDSAGTFGNNNPVIQWGLNNGLNQRWQLTQNSDESWNIISLSTWQALDCGASDTNGAEAIQWQSTRDSNQRWIINELSDGTYSIESQATGKALDGGSSTTNGDALIQWGWNGGSQQRWVLH